MEMKANEQAKHFFDVCNKLFQLFANKLALHSFKHVTLGSKEKDLNRVNKIERKSKDTSLTTVQVQNIDSDDFFKEVTVGASSAKAVSIESEPEAEKVTRKMKKKPSMKKSSTMQPVGSTLGSKTIRPLKPVMRAASNIDERSGKFIQDMKEAIKTGSRLQPRAL